MYANHDSSTAGEALVSECRRCCQEGGEVAKVNESHSSTTDRSAESSMEPINPSDWLSSAPGIIITYHALIDRSIDSLDPNL